jgi:hypothetical protein
MSGPKNIHGARRPPRRRPVLGLTAVWLLTIIAVSGLLSACDETVDAFVEEDRYFTVYGFLDTATDEQFVRVIALRTTFGVSGQDPIDATVSTTAQEDGSVVVWKDSLVAYGDGSFGHIFHVRMQPIPGWTYRFDITRSDGNQASATTTIPIVTNVTLEEPRIAVSNVTQKVRWDGIDFPPFRVEVWYRFQNARPNQPFLNAVLTYEEDKYGSTVGGGENWEIVVRLTDDKEDVTRDLGIFGDARPFLMGVGMRLTMSDDQWRPPKGVFDREILVQPGTFSNVQNGFGFLGSVNQFTIEWTLAPDIVERIGYTFPSKR